MPTTEQWPEPWPDIDTTIRDVHAALDIGNLASVCDGTMDDLARRLRDVRAAMMSLNTMRDELEMTLIDSMDTDDVLTGSGMLRRKERSPRTSWRDDDARDRFNETLVSAIVADVALDVATGELDPVKRNVARATAALFMDVLYQQSGIKTAAARRLDIDVSEFRSKQHAGYTIELETAIDDEDER